ncbi:MAG: magnesium chelatase ATPase subunit I [Granulosicoccus sp.]|nr:magnesium chelatase ATPase subunit I [Granulosicoccus sp.]
MTIAYPFSAIVGQEDMKLSLQMAAIDASIGGVLVLGDRGTGKTTAMRALAALLPPIDVVEGCRFACDPAQPQSFCDECKSLQDSTEIRSRTLATPVVDLPLGASEDRVVGALDLEKALTSGVKAFEPGLLAAANRGFLYIDEVNLLEDHLVDLLLDVAVSGVNVVERDGLSIRHAARFLLVGSGNPEEGELRPQLLDRFGLSVEVRTPQDIKLRMQIVRLRDSFEQSPEAFCKQYADRDAAVRESLLRARTIIQDVQVEDDALQMMSQLCIALGTDGLRGELTLMRACRAYAALRGEQQVQREHIRRVAAMALRHRLRRDPLDESGSTARVDRALDATGLADA